MLPARKCLQNHLNTSLPSKGTSNINTAIHLVISQCFSGISPSSRSIGAVWKRAAGAHSCWEIQKPGVVFNTDVPSSPTHKTRKRTPSFQLEQRHSEVPEIPRVQNEGNAEDVVWS